MAAEAPILSLRDVEVHLGGDPLFGPLEMYLAASSRSCLVGRNGTGKSTLMRIIANQRQPDAGERFAVPGLRVAYLAQEPDFSAFKTVGEFVADGLADPDSTWLADSELLEAGLDADRDPMTLSGGEGRRAALARMFAGEPDFLLLDEPTNHLDIPAIEALEDKLSKYRGGYLIVSHDRTFLRRLTKEVHWLDRGIIRTAPTGFDGFEDWMESELAREEEEAHKLNRKIVRETAWLHKGVTARRKRNMGRLRRLNDLRQERANRRAPTGQASLTAAAGEASGKLVLEAVDVSKKYDDKVILDHFSTRILRGDRIAIIGRNGAGKTTLLKLLLGDIQPDSGTVRLGSRLDIAYIDQRRDALDPNATLWDTLCDSGGDHIDVRGTPRHVVSYLRDFLFDESQARSPVHALSGGERNRLILAKKLAKPANLLVLDEPTNDLDMETLDLLVEVLSDYEGTLLLVSHDRDFIDRLVTGTFALEGDGKATEYPGGYTDYRRQRQATTELGDDRRGTKASESRKPARPAAKLSYKDQRRLDNLPKDIARLDKAIEKLEKILDDAGLFARDPDSFNAAVASLDKARSDKAGMEEEWLELEMKREMLAEGQTG
ncbi:ATP-binding cassette domain-containing protein [Alphaproteobacteria bacterium HT1-32]|nr:ATP-binding cassette domain-containing protein [Alphaproteobacteria bacterium HT1-32]